MEELNCGSQSGGSLTFLVGDSARTQNEGTPHVLPKDGRLLEKQTSRRHKTPTMEMPDGSFFSLGGLCMKEGEVC